jgi:hypothetical protein
MPSSSYGDRHFVKGITWLYYWPTMENLFVGALIFVVGLFSHSFLPSYMKKKGENLATKGDIQDLAAQTALLTQTAKEIETKIYGQSVG